LSRSVLPMALLNPRGWLFRGSVLTSWLMILAGSVIGWDSVIRIGELLFLANFLVATASLAKEWEVTGRAVSSLASLEGFGTDERVRIKRLVEAIRWRPVAELLAAPFSILWQSKAKCGVKNGL